MLVVIMELLTGCLDIGCVAYVHMMDLNKYSHIECIYVDIVNLAIQYIYEHYKE